MPFLYHKFLRFDTRTDRLGDYHLVDYLSHQRTKSNRSAGTIVALPAGR